MANILYLRGWPCTHAEGPTLEAEVKALYSREGVSYVRLHIKSIIQIISTNSTA